MSTTTHISSTNDLQLALHDFGGNGDPVFLSHATGFHAHCFDPIATILSASFHCMGVDYRGHGDSQTIDTADLKWADYGDDAIAAARVMFAKAANTPLIGVGHSMGGAALLYAALYEPHLFRALFVYEPIVFPPGGIREDGVPNPMVEGARKRRSTFDSYDAAIANFASKPPMMYFDPVARDAYVRHGFAQMPDGTVELKCRPATEARTYETGGTAPQWHELSSIKTPTWVMAGMQQPSQPSLISPLVAHELPFGTYVQWDELGHFAPFEHPAHIAGFVGRTAATLQ
ncbi:MAG: alpha/beta hydrolase [Ilumatobacteraceae bacterium]|nr:alpha/beta hydrolase [Ilumatobacteraceae bacterium]